GTWRKCSWTSPATARPPPSCRSPRHERAGHRGGLPRALRLAAAGGDQPAPSLRPALVLAAPAGTRLLADGADGAVGLHHHLLPAAQLLADQRRRRPGQRRPA